MTVPSGKRIHSLVAAGIRLRFDLHQSPDDDLIDDAVAIVGQEEPSILDDPDLGDVDLGRVLQPEAADGCDRELRDGRHARMLPDRHVPELQRRSRLEPQDVEAQDRPHALDALAPAVVVGVLERLAAGSSERSSRITVASRRASSSGHAIGELELPDDQTPFGSEPSPTDDLVVPRWSMGIEIDGTRIGDAASTDAGSIDGDRARALGTS